MTTTEHQLNCAIVSSANLRDVTALGVKADHFTDPTEKRVFELIDEHLQMYRKVPGPDAVLKAYPNYNFGDTPEPVEYYAEQVVDDHINRTLMSGLVEVTERIGEPDVTGRNLQKELEDLVFGARVTASQGAMVDLFQTQRSFYDEEFPLRRKLGYLRGISTGFDDLDQAIGGYQPQQLITFFGLAKHGKSTMMLASALSAKQSGYNPMFVTFEMSADEQRDRIQSLVTGMSLSKIMEGRLTFNEREEFDRITRRNEVLTRFIVIEDRNSVLTVSGLNQRILEVEPDIVFVDGVYWMDAPGERKSTEALTHLTNGLKRLAQSHGIPVVISTQALNSRSRNGLHAGSIGYSSSFEQDSDVAIGVYKLTPTLTEFRVHAVRAGRNASVFLRIDWEKGLIEVVDPAVAQAEIDGGSAVSGISKKGMTYI